MAVTHHINPYLPPHVGGISPTIMLNIPGLSKAATPRNLLDRLYRQQSEMAGLMKRIDKLQSEIDTTTQELERYGIQYTSPTSKAAATSTQTQAYPTQVVSPVHTRNTQPTTMAETATAHPTNVTRQHSVASSNNSVKPAVPAANRNGIVTQKAAPISQPSRTSQQPTNSIKVEGMVDVMRNRMQSYTDAVNVVDVENEGYLIEHGHYLPGDGTGRSRPTPEGYRVTVHKSSNTGNTYRKVYVPALRITCHLEQPLPRDSNQKRQVIKEWLAANRWLCGINPQKKQFTIEHDVWGYEYSPYVNADGEQGTNILYVYIGCESFESCAPTPSLIA